MDPYRPLDDAARVMARATLSSAHGALGTLRDGTPLVTRVGCLWLGGEVGLTMLLSDLSDHAKALAENPACSILLGEPGSKGDPLTHPRLTVIGCAEACDKAALRDAYLAARPKAGLYYDFTDFRLLRIAPTEGLLNGGFGKAYRFSAADLEAL